MFNSFSFGKIKALESGSRIKETYKTGDRKIFDVTPMPSLTHAISGRFVIQSVESGKELKNLMYVRECEEETKKIVKTPSHFSMGWVNVVTQRPPLPHRPYQPHTHSRHLTLNVHFQPHLLTRLLRYDSLG